MALPAYCYYKASPWAAQLLFEHVRRVHALCTAHKGSCCACVQGPGLSDDVLLQRARPWTLFPRPEACPHQVLSCHCPPLCRWWRPRCCPCLLRCRQRACGTAECIAELARRARTRSRGAPKRGRPKRTSAEPGGACLGTSNVRTCKALARLKLSMHMWDACGIVHQLSFFQPFHLCRAGCSPTASLPGALGGGSRSTCPRWRSRCSLAVPLEQVLRPRA